MDLRLPAVVLQGEITNHVKTTGDTMTGPLAMSGAAVNEARGADIASAATVNLDTATGNVVDVTGATGITAITLSDGRRRTVRFTGALTLTNGASLVLFGANITTAAGDYAEFVGRAAGVVHLVAYSRAASMPVSAAGADTLTNKTLTNPAYTDQTLADGATINWDMNLGSIANVTLGGNRTMAAPTNLKKGVYVLHVLQDGTGSRTITWNAVFKWPFAVAPVLSTGINKRDILSFVCDGTNLYGSYMLDVR